MLIVEHRELIGFWIICVGLLQEKQEFTWSAAWILTMTIECFGDTTQKGMKDFHDCQ